MSWLEIALGVLAFLWLVVGLPICCERIAADIIRRQDEDGS